MVACVAVIGFVVYILVVAIRAGSLGAVDFLSSCVLILAATWSFRRTRKSIKSFRRYQVAWVIFPSMGVLLVLAGSLSMLRVFGPQGGESFGRSVALGDQPPYALDLEIEEVNTSDRTLHYKVLPGSAASPERQALFRATSGVTIVEGCDPHAGCNLIAAHQNDIVHVRISSPLNAGPGTEFFSFPLRCYVNQPTFSAPTAAGCSESDGIGINRAEMTDGDPRRYPLDTYTFSHGSKLSPVTGLDLVFDCQGVDLSPLASSAVRVGLPGKAGPWRLSQVSWEPTVGAGEVFRASILVAVNRDWQTEFYVLSLALVPLLFAILFIHLLFFNPSTRDSGVPDFLVALAATTLAVVPLRAVLVPSSMLDLTLVDLVLGVGAASLVSVGLVAYGRDLYRLKRPPGGPDDPSGNGPVLPNVSPAAK
jgi:hypothetical protein